MFLRSFLLCFFNKFCMANRAGNLNFPFSTRNAQRVFAVRAFVIPVGLGILNAGLFPLKPAFDWIPER